MEPGSCGVCVAVKLVVQKTSLKTPETLNCEAEQWKVVVTEGNVTIQGVDNVKLINWHWKEMEVSGH